MVIVNGRLEYRHGPGHGVAIFHIIVDDDGSFSGSALNMGNKLPQSLEGKVLGNSIEADTGNRYCQFHLTLQRE
jgi:hypothetical protein